MVRVLLCEEEPTSNPVDKWRDALMAYILENWSILRPQIGGCPAQTKDPKACHQCENAQVLSCLTIENEDNIEEIQNARNRRNLT